MFMPCIKTSLTVMIVFMGLGLFAQNNSVVKDGASPKLVSGQFVFTEGPAADKKGNVYFTDQPNNAIWKYSINGKLTKYLDSAGRSNGLYFDKKGNLYTAADDKNQLWRINKNKNITVVVNNLDGKLLNGPNDLWIHPNGGIYFTDPFYWRDYWTRTKTMEQPGQRVYYLPTGQQVPIPLTNNLKSPNGIIGSPNGKHLFVADIKDNKTWKYDILPDGTLTNATLLINQGSDGMTIDNLGNIYLTGKGVTVVSPEGKINKQIPINENWTANVTFGGRKFNQLFITASKSVYVLDMNVKGGGH